MVHRRRARSESGASILELAILTPVMVLIVMGVLDLSRAYRMQIRLENAAREGAAYAQTWPNSVDCGLDPDIEDRVRAEDDGLVTLADSHIEVFTYDDFGNEVPVSGCDGTLVSAGDLVRVDVHETFDVMVPMVEDVVGSSIDLTGSAEIRVQEK